MSPFTKKCIICGWAGPKAARPSSDAMFMVCEHCLSVTKPKVLVSALRQAAIERAIPQSEGIIFCIGDRPKAI